MSNHHAPPHPPTPENQPPPGAVHWSERARHCDLGDRYLNSLAVEALFAAGHSDKAEKTAMLFTRDGDQVGRRRVLGVWLLGLGFGCV